jgi:DNA transformation protein
MDADVGFAALKSLGPRSADMLECAGITSIPQLRALGSVAAFAAVRKVNPRVSLNLLWALESALCGKSWQVVAREHRTSLLLALDALERTR